MSSARPTFGDFLASAHRHLAAASTAQSATVTPGRDVEDVADAVAHVASVLSRYTADLTRMTRQLPDKQLTRVGPWDRAAIEAHDALVSAVLALGRGTSPASIADHAGTSVAARQVRGAGTSLAAGRDLLQGHFSTGPTGARRYESSWSLAITSPAVSRALLSEVASLALETAALSPALPPPTIDPRTHDARTRLNTARYWLAQPDACVYKAERSEPSEFAGREILRMVPANVMPSRQVPENATHVPKLLEAVVTTAERARQAAWAAARVDPSSTAISVSSWHRIAAASTVTSHHCHLLYRTLADRVGNEDSGQFRAKLLEAAADASSAREYWLDSAREFQEITTEIRRHISPAALEAADLALWTGKLVYADSYWTLSSGPSCPVRTGDTLVPRLEDMAAVVGAVHETSEALNSLAASNLQQARLAIDGRRLLVPTRSLPERYDVPMRFTAAPKPYEVSLIACCQDTVRAAARATESSAEIAGIVGASSKTLAAARSAAHDGPEVARPHRTTGKTVTTAHEIVPGPVESKLRSMGITNARSLWRASAVDQSAQQVVRDAMAGLADRREADPPPSRGAPLEADSSAGLADRWQKRGTAAVADSEREAEA